MGNKRDTSKGGEMPATLVRVFNSRVQKVRPRNTNRYNLRLYHQKTAESSVSHPLGSLCVLPTEIIDEITRFVLLPEAVEAGDCECESCERALVNGQAPEALFCNFKLKKQLPSLMFVNSVFFEIVVSTITRCKTMVSPEVLVQIEDEGLVHSRWLRSPSFGGYRTVPKLKITVEILHQFSNDYLGGNVKRFWDIRDGVVNDAARSILHCLGPILSINRKPYTTFTIQEVVVDIQTPLGVFHHQFGPPLISTPGGGLEGRRDTHPDHVVQPSWIANMLVMTIPALLREAYFWSWEESREKVTTIFHKIGRIAVELDGIPVGEPASISGFTDDLTASIVQKANDRELGYVVRYLHQWLRTRKQLGFASDQALANKIRMRFNEGSRWEKTGKTYDTMKACMVPRMTIRHPSEAFVRNIIREHS